MRRGRLCGCERPSRRHFFLTLSSTPLGQLVGDGADPTAAMMAAPSVWLSAVADTNLSPRSGRRRAFYNSLVRGGDVHGKPVRGLMLVAAFAKR